MKGSRKRLDSEGMLQELLQYDGETGTRRLNDWEVQFVEDLGRQMRRGETMFWTNKQRNKIAEIWGQIFNNERSNATRMSKAKGVVTQCRICERKVKLLGTDTCEKCMKQLAADEHIAQERDDVPF